jgi:hypothetical protein
MFWIERNEMRGLVSRTRTRFRSALTVCRMYCLIRLQILTNVCYTLAARMKQKRWSVRSDMTVALSRSPARLLFILLDR